MIAWNPAGSLMASEASANILASGSEDKRIRIWNAETAEGVTKLEERRGALVAGAWSSDGLRLATVDVHGVLKVWPVPDAAR